MSVVDRSLLQPVGVGVVTALVGFTSSAAVVLAGLRAAGASSAQAASGLLALCLAVGLGAVFASYRHRVPVSLAWSTPGAAVLAAGGAVAGGWPGAVGAFLVCGLLVVLTAAWSGLGRLVQAVPVPVAQAMLAGVLLPLCLRPVAALAAAPLLVAPVVLVWLAGVRFAPRWAVPAAFALAAALAVGSVLAGGGAFAVAPPALELTVPRFSLAAAVGVALPLYVVTMASQNVPGVAVMAAHGHRVPWRSALLVTGAGTLLAAPAGGHVVNLAAITAALPASADAHPDPARRWVAAHASGWTYLVLGALSPLLVALVEQAPGGLVETVAGLALVATLAASLQAATIDPAARTPAVVAFLTAASPLVVLGVASAFWSLLAGLLTWAALAPRAPRRVRG